jgi:predicted AAA+ superfamily ATPase
MKENILNPEIKYIKRRITPKIKGIIEKFPVAVVTGARQVGKSTMLKHDFKDFSYLTMDDYNIREQAKLDPQSLWQTTDRMILDEAQKAPEIFDAVKLAVDSNPRRKFILSGSANLLLMEQVTETLAGRALYFELLPITFGEQKGIREIRNFTNLWDSDHVEAERIIETVDPLPFMMRGFMPPLLSITDAGDAAVWLEGYVSTYLEKDLRELSQVESLIEFRKVMQALALRTGNVLNQAEVARGSGASHPTAFRYIKLLEVSNIIQRIPAYSVSRTKRIVKSPKVFYVDPALSIFLSGYYDRDSLGKCRELGSFFETMVYLHLRGLCEAMTPRAGLYYWRTVDGKEVDFVIEHGRKLLAVEVKLTENPTVSDIKNMLLFMDEYPETVRGIVIHAGKSIKWLHSKVIAVPWWWIDS